MTSFRFPENVFVLGVRVRVRVRARVRFIVMVRVSGNTFLVKRPFGQVY